MSAVSSPGGAGRQAVGRRSYGLFALLLLPFGYVLLASTSGFNWIDSWHDEQRAVQAGILLVICLAFAVTAFSGWIGRIRPSALLLGSFVLGTVSAIRSSHVQAGLAELGLWLSLLVLALFVTAVIRAHQQLCLKWLPRIILLLALAHVTGILARYAAAIELQRPMDSLVLLLGYANPRFPSALYALLMPFLASLTMTGSERRGLRVISGMSLAFLWCFNLALETRAVFFAYLLGLPLVAFMLGWRNARPLVSVFIATAVAGLLMYALLFIGLPKWAGAGLELAGRTDSLLSPNGRQLLFASSWESIRSAPFLGIGPMAFAAIPHVWAAHPHNWVLQVAAEWGIPAAILVVVAVVRFIVLKGKAVRMQAEHAAPVVPMLTAAFMSVVVGLIYGLVDGNLLMPVSQTAFFLCLGILMGSAPERVAANEPRGSNTVFTRHALALAILVGLYAFVSYAIETLPQQEAARREYHRIYSADRFFVPRFWEQGLLLSR